MNYIHANWCFHSQKLSHLLLPITRDKQHEPFMRIIIFWWSSFPSKERPQCNCILVHLCHNNRLPQPCPAADTTGVYGAPRGGLVLRWQSPFCGQHNRNHNSVSHTSTHSVFKLANLMDCKTYYEYMHVYWRNLKRLDNVRLWMYISWPVTKVKNLKNILNYHSCF